MDPVTFRSGAPERGREKFTAEVIRRDSRFILPDIAEERYVRVRAVVRQYVVMPRAAGDLLEER